tara:strand:+ start:5047 stop:5331 length:285 start_codon:yes stop_codon:yes gene_type:complete
MSKSWAFQMSARIAASCPLPQRQRQKIQPGTAQKQEENAFGYICAPKEKAGTSPVENPTTQQRCQSNADPEKVQDVEVTSGSMGTTGNRANTTL